MIASIPQPGIAYPRPNYYSQTEFLRQNAASSRLDLAAGGRALLASEDLIVGLQRGLEGELAEASTVVMYECGVAWGEEDMANFEQRFEREYGRQAREANIQFVLECWWWPLTAAGWGSWRVDLTRLNQGCVMVDLFQSAVAHSLERVGKPVCHLYAGLMAGAFGHLFSLPLSCIEIQCYAMGEDRCRFLVGHASRIDAAEFWLQEGASAEEIAARLPSQTFAS